MNRKFFNLLLMGALAVTAIGSVSSCKDYDDDINNLQEQIDKAALKTDVDALKTTLTNVQTTAESAKTTAESALAAATKAQSTADAAATKEALAEVKAVADKAAADVAQAITDAAAANEAAAEAKADAAAKAQEAKDYADEQIAAAVEGIETKLAGLANQDEVTAAISRIAAIEADYTTAATLTESLGDLETKINNATKDEISKLQIVVNTYEGGINSLYSAVTSVELVGSYSAQKFLSGESNANAFNLTITCGVVDQAYYYEFGKNEKAKDYDGDDAVKKTWLYNANSTVEYTYGTQFSYSDGELVVRVNPTNVELKPEMIKFFDTKGNDLDGVIEVASVKKFDDLLTKTRGTGNATGLWKVALKTTKNVSNTNKSVTKNSNGTDFILYALGVNNTAASTEFENAADRYVVSSYDVTFKAQQYKAATKLDNVEVKEASKGKDGWKKLSTQDDLNDGTHILTVNNGEEFQVRFTNSEATGTGKGAVKDVEYFYVVRDDYAAIAASNSASSEYNAWKNYQYTGLGEMVAVNHGEGIATLSVTIPSSQRTGDEIQFRVYAVNYNGSLVEENGKAFRVFVGTDLTQATLTANVVAVGHGSMETGWVALGTTLSDDGTELSQYNTTTNDFLTNKITLKSNGKDVKFKAQFAKSADGKTTAEKNSEIKYIRLVVADGTSITNWKDGSEITGSFVNYKSNDANLALNTISLKLTKVMPTAEYTKSKMGYSWKDKQLVNGVYTAYLYPTGDTWTTAADEGYKKMTQALNNLDKNFGSSDTHTKIFFANTVKAYDYTAYKERYVGCHEANNSNSFTLNVSNEKVDGTLLIDGTTEHETVIGYDYGAISSEQNYSEWYADEYDSYGIYTNKVFVPVETVQTVFACPLSKTTFAFAPKTVKTYAADGSTVTGTKDLDVKVLKYNVAQPVNLSNEENIASYLIATNSYDNTTFGGFFYDAATATNCLRKKLYLSGNDHASAKLISDGSGDADYFRVEIDADGKFTFKPNSSASVPNEDVPSTLVLTLKDCFGHKYEYKLGGFVVQK